MTKTGGMCEGPQLTPGWVEVRGFPHPEGAVWVMEPPLAGHRWGHSLWGSLRPPSEKERWWPLAPPGHMQGPGAQQVHCPCLSISHSVFQKRHHSLMPGRWNLWVKRKEIICSKAFFQHFSLCCQHLASAGSYLLSSCGDFTREGKKNPCCPPSGSDAPGIGSPCFPGGVRPQECLCPWRPCTATFTIKEVNYTEQGNCHYSRRKFWDIFS